MGILGRVETATPSLRFVERRPELSKGEFYVPQRILQQAWLIEIYDEGEPLSDELEWRDVPLAKEVKDGTA